jgi:hypothetical protein
MSVIPATACCCTAPTCPFRDVCRVGEEWWDKLRAEYITVGRPRGPTVYPGTYWAAWHNGMSLQSVLDVDLNLQVVKRTLVQTPCGAIPGCPGVNLPIDGVCTTTGFMTANSGCQQTTYTDNFNWNLNTTFTLRGVNPEQNREVARDFNPHLQDFPQIPDPSTPDHTQLGKPYCAIPPGYYPCGIQGSCNTGTCADANEATTFGSSPAWWPGENRKLIPRFTVKGATVQRTAIPSSSYPQVASCNAVSYQNRCTTTLSNFVEDICLDFPIIVLPGHSGLMCDGQPSIPCNIVNKELGATSCIWGFDITEPQLLAGLNALGLPDGTYVGTRTNAWIVKYTSGGNQKVRFFFDIGSQIAAPGETFKFTSNTVITEKATATRRFATTSWYFNLDFNFTPRKWCLNSPQCDCVQSYCENCPPVLNYSITASVSDQCNTNDVLLDLNVGLEEVALNWWFSDTHHQLCPCGTNCGSSGFCGIFGSGTWCWQWNNLPEGGFGIPAGATPSSPYGTKATRRYLGDEPIERGHPFWRRYRNRYNHTLTTNDWWENGYSDLFSRCRVGVYGNIISLSQVYATGHVAQPFEYCCDGSTFIAGFAKSPDPAFCPTCACFCTVPDQTGTSSCYACLPQGCYDVEPSWWTGCPASNPYPSGTCGPTTKSQDPYTGDPNAVIPCFSIALFDYCNDFHKCGNQVLSLCGGLGFLSCEIAGTAYSVVLPDTVVIEWDPKQSCCPTGTYNAKIASEATVCDGKSGWSNSNITVVVS